MQVKPPLFFLSDEDQSEEIESFLEDSGSELVDRKKVLKALKVLHIRQAKFQSLQNSGRHDKVIV